MDELLGPKIWSKMVNQSIKPEYLEGTPLQVAITRRNAKAFAFLIRSGVDVNAHYPLKRGHQDRISPLLHALESGLPNIAYLVTTQNPTNITQGNKYGETPLHFAVKFRHEKLLNALLQWNHLINAKNNNGKTALMLAAELEDIIILQKLILHGASLDEQDSTGKTALMISTNKGDINTLKMLIVNGADLDKQDTKGFTAMMIAACQSSIHYSKEKFSDPQFARCVDLLLEANADVNLQNEEKKTALLIACDCYNGNQQVVISFFHAGSDVNKADNEGDTPLTCACYEGHDKLASILIDHGANVNHITDDGQFCTPLHLIAKDLQVTGQEAERNIVKKLLDAGANPDLNSVICLAASNYKTQMVKSLLEAGADINITDPSYGTVLYIAAYTGNHKLAKLALQFKTKINIQEKPDGNSVHPEEPDKFALMLTFAAGEQFPFFDFVDFHIPTEIHESREDISLGNLSRKAIRKFAAKDNGQNLFEISKMLPLPCILQNYIIFDMSLSETEEEFYKQIDEPKHYEYDSEDSDEEECIDY